MKQHALAAQQFGATADAYRTSAVHAQGHDLQRLAALARALPGGLALDIGCGAGHASFALAAGGMQVSACDLSANMLAVVAHEAAARGLATITPCQTQAEVLPFANATFDLAVTRFSAHHWSDVPAALRELHRVLKPHGVLVVIDAVAPERPACDTVLQTVEILRDASHVRDYPVSEWTRMLQHSGFVAPQTEVWGLTMDFASWVARMRTPALRQQAIRDVLAHAAQEVRETLRVQEDGSFDLPVAWMQTRPGAT